MPRYRRRSNRSRHARRSTARRNRPGRPPGWSAPSASRRATRDRGRAAAVALATARARTGQERLRHVACRSWPYTSWPGFVPAIRVFSCPVRALAVARATAAARPRSVRAARRASRTLRVGHAVLDPLRALDAVGRVHAGRLVVDDVGQRRLAGLGVEFVHALGAVGDALMALAERHVDGGADAREFQMLEG